MWIFGTALGEFPAPAVRFILQTAVCRMEIRVHCRSFSRCCFSFSIRTLRTMPSNLAGCILPYTVFANQRDRRQGAAADTGDAVDAELAVRGGLPVPDLQLAFEVSG